MWNDLLVKLLTLLSRRWELPMFSGDIDLSEQSDSVPWSQWSLTIRSYFGKFNRTTTWMLQQVETSVDDPNITDKYGDDKSGEAVLGTGVLCACSDLLEQSAAGGPTSSQRFRVRGMEAGVRGVRATSSSKGPKERARNSCRQRSQLSRFRRSVSKRAD